MKHINIIKTANCLSLPIGVLKDRNIAILESIVEYLKDEQNMKYSEIARLLNRDDRTIWTVYKRAKKKRVNLNKMSIKCKNVSALI